MSPSFHQSAVLKANELWAARPIFLDTETTGLDNNAEIVEISIIDFDGSVLLDTLVKPIKPIPADATRLHGITNAMVSQSSNWLNVWSQVEKLLKERTIGIYNADFDLRMMRQSHQIIGMPWRPPVSRIFCIMKLFADFSGWGKWLSLEEAGRQCGIRLPNSHRAREDTLLALEVFKYMVNDGGKSDLVT